MAAIEFIDVRKSYGALQVVHGINVAVTDGEFVVLVGPSGCGKSTLLRMVAGLEEISAGTIRIGDRVVNDLEPKDRDCAMVFQNYALYPHMSVYDNMAYGLKIRGLAKSDIDKRVNVAASILELGNFLQRKPRQLSGGQRQRVAMGRAIVREPAVFLFDEPLSNLDAKLRVQTRLEIQKLHRRLKTTSLYVTHDQVEAMTLAQRMIVMNAGRAEQIGTPDDVYSRPATTFVASFIGSPPMNLFKGRLASDGNTFEALETRIALPENAMSLAGRELILGIRPEHMKLGGNNLSMEVETVEMLGAEHLIHGTVAGHDTIVRTGPHDNPAPGSILQLGLKAGSAHWFDPATTQRISDADRTRSVALQAPTLCAEIRNLALCNRHTAPARARAIGSRARLQSRAAGFYFGIDKLFDTAAGQAHQVVVMRAFIQLEHRAATFEVVARQ